MATTFTSAIQNASTARPAPARAPFVSAALSGEDSGSAGSPSSESMPEGNAGPSLSSTPGSDASDSAGSLSAALAVASVSEDSPFVNGVD